jgi:hypothetical protein
LATSVESEMDESGCAIDVGTITSSISDEII